MKKFMKELRRKLLLLATTIFVVSFATFIISLFIGFYGKIVVWAMVTSFISSAAVWILAGSPTNEDYLRYLKRHKH